MNRRTTGIVFISIAAFLYASRYLAAAIYMNNLGSHGRDLFQSAMSYVGPDLHLWALAALIIGVFYLVWAERIDLKKKAE